METFFDVLLDAFLDTIKLVPILLIVYFLIELLEYKNVFKFEKSKSLNGKASPAIGALVGSVPQCGFSVISADLFAKQKISIGALVAVFVATSDEALPIMLSDYKNIPSLLLLIFTKIIVGIIAGYFAMLLQKLIFSKNEKKTINSISKKSLAQSNNSTLNDTDHKHENEEHDHHDDEHHEHSHEENENLHIHACCNHDIENNKFNFKHPLVHTLKISLWIFAINIVFGLIIALVGEDNLMEFLQTGKALQPIFAVIVGLIPNCASSVVLTELYLMGGLEFGAIVAGLSVNAGIGFLVLFKENKNIKQNLFILFVILGCSLAFGYALQFLPFEFLRI